MVLSEGKALCRHRALSSVCAGLYSPLMELSLLCRLLLVEGSIAEKWKERLGKKIKVRK